MNKLAERIKKRFSAQAVYLYGSFSKGGVHEGSDIDLVVVADFKERMFDRIGKILDMTLLPIEPICYTPEEFASMKASGNPFISEVLKGKRLV